MQHGTKKDKAIMNESTLGFRFVQAGSEPEETKRLSDKSQRFDWVRDLHSKETSLFQARVRSAQERFEDRTQKALRKMLGELAAKPQWPWDLWMDWSKYAVDF